MDKEEACEIAAGFADLGYEIVATGGTAEYLNNHGVKVRVATKVSEGSPNILDEIKEGHISMVINTTNHGVMLNATALKSAARRLSMPSPA